MTLQQLRYLVRVAQTGSFSKASQSLFVSQPTLSQQIQALEQDLAVKLIERRSHHGEGVALTPFGRFVVEQAQAMLAIEERIYRARAEAGRAPRVLRVGSIHAAIEPLLWEAARMTSAGQGVRLEVHEGGSVDIADALREGRLELGIVAEGGGVALHRDFAYEVLSRCDLSVCLPPGHPLAGKPAVAVEELAGHPFVGLSKGFALHEVARWYLEQLPPPAVIYANSTEAVLEFVARGVGISILPALVLATARRATEVVSRPLLSPEAPRWHWLLIWNKHRALDALEQRFVQALIARAQRGAVVSRPSILPLDAV